MNVDEIRSGLDKLEPSVPWSHYFDLGDGIHTVNPDDGKWFGKATGLGKLGDLIPVLATHHTRNGSLEGLRVLDIACAEGRHSITMAQAGASVVGVEGRELYVKRASFVADVLGLDNVNFLQGDCRELPAMDLGSFDVTLCSGILHHLGAESFEPFIQDMAKLTNDTLFMYTHVSSAEAIERFRLTGPEKIGNKYVGYLFQEHSETASEQERKDKVRASLDNTYSFWAEADSLYRAVRDAGFASISYQVHPHIFGLSNLGFRQILIARK